MPASVWFTYLSDENDVSDASRHQGGVDLVARNLLQLGVVDGGLQGHRQ